MRRTIPSNAAAEFARRFRLLMGYHDLTLRDVARATRCAVSTVGTWKNGRVPSSRRVLEKLAEIFHVDVEYLLEGRAGRPTTREVDDAVGRILEDLNILFAALDSHRSAEPAPVRQDRADGARKRP